MEYQLPYRFPTLCFAFLVTTLLVQQSRADDWPHWMGPGSNGVWSETGMIDSFPESGAKILWRKPIGAGYAGPAIVDQRVYIMDRTKPESEEQKDPKEKGRSIPGGERIQCLDANTGEPVWELKYDCPYRIAYPSGPRCTPTVDGDRVYVLGAMGHLHCLNKNDGTIVWKKVLSEEYNVKPPLWGYASHPVVDGERLLVPVGKDGNGIVAFNKLTGEEIWKSVTTSDVAYAPLVFFEEEVEGQKVRQLIFWHADGVTSLNPVDGKEHWTIKFPEEVNPSQTSIATPVVIGNKILVSEFYKGSLLLEVSSNPPAAKELWRSFKTDPRHEKSLNSMMATPVAIEGHAIGVGFNSRGGGILRCIDLETGEAKWTDDKFLADKPVMFGTAFITPNEDKFFLFGDVGELIIAKMNVDGFEELGRAKLLEATTPSRGRKVVWCHPAYSDGKMVTKNDEEIVCVDLRRNE